MILKPIIAPSVLNADFLRLGESVRAIENGGASLVHLDIMDGNFVPNISFGEGIAKSIGVGTSLPLDCHLMIAHPELYIENFIRIGCEYITVHVEATNHLDRLLNRIKELGARPAVALNPATPLESILPVLDLVEMVLVMSVNPGFGGQSFIPYTLEKVRRLRSLKKNLDIQIDGGINLQTIRLAQEAGANIFVVGSAIFGTENPEETCRQFVSIISGD